MKKLNVFSAFLILLVLSSCGGKEFKKNPVDEVIKEMPSTTKFTVILNDMDVEGSFFKTFKHQYKIIEEKIVAVPEQTTGDGISEISMQEDAGVPVERITDWYEVDERFFKQHQDNMGMEIAARGDDGKVTKSVAPAGYSQYVGNQRYGRWENRGGTSFWAFYGQYAFMSRMFGMGAYPIQRGYYNTYRGSYYGTGRAYYGPTTAAGGRMYGTNSAYNRSTRPNSSWSKNNSSFKNRVAGRTSRSSSRYGGSSSRSRGGGFGK